MGWWIARQPVTASHPLVTERPAVTENLGHDIPELGGAQPLAASVPGDL